MRFSKVSILCWVLSAYIVSAFQDQLLKRCDQSGFCKRNRVYAENQRNTKNSHYSVDIDSLNINPYGHSVEGTIYKTIVANESERRIPLFFNLDFIDDDKVRFQLDEHRGSDHTVDSQINSRYHETAMWAFDSRYNPSITRAYGKRSGFWSKDKYIVKANDLKVIINLSKFQLTVQKGSQNIITINNEQLLNFEHHRALEANWLNMNKEEEPFDMFRDSFKDCKSDSLPFGPESVAIDFQFPGVKNLYGIPEHADSFRLRETSNTDPYRLFNVDVFQYNLNSTSPMYGAIPLLVGIAEKSAVGVFWINPSDTWVDISYSSNGASSHWISESGIIDVIIIIQDSPKLVTESYLAITGKPQLPLISSIGYHQCRWNYNDEGDVLAVDAQMDKWEIPYDFIWLDLEYTDKKQYFTWNPDAFPDPERMLQKLSKVGRNLVTLIDPHIKNNYFISDAIKSSGTAVRNAFNKIFYGQCWPGESIWIDTFNPVAREIWSKFLHTFWRNCSNLYIWNDMNEPSIFDGPETTAPKDLLHYNGFEERSVHNLYGLTVHQATFDSSIERDGNKRPFILTRSFFSGSQRTAATWTGDNVANWEYLQISIPMILSQNIAGMTNSGADVAGFFGDPNDELLIRWYQTGIWYPFFRGHAHIDSRRREPYLLNEPARSIIRKAIHLRYQLLPTFYTAFYDAHSRGVPIFNPMIYEHPSVPEFYSIDDQFYLGEQGILVKPVTTPNTETLSVIFPAGVHYDLLTLEIVHSGPLESKTVSSALDKSPVFIEGGHIIVKRDKYRRSAKLMQHDPYTLLIAPDNKGHARGKVYIDDGESLSHEDGVYLEIEFEFTGQNLSASIRHAHESFPLGDLMIEKIIIAKHPNLNLANEAAVKLGDSEIPVSIEDTHSSYIISNPHLRIADAWLINF